MQKFQEDQILFEAIEEYRSGNQDKATFIYESTKKYTYKVVHQEVARYKSQSILTGDEISVTEDIMQDLYIEFFNKIAKFKNENPRSIFKWISVVSHRMLSDYVDKNKMEVLQFEKDEDYREDNDIWDSSEINDSDMESNHELLPEAALEDKEFRQLILDFIQSLPEAQAQTILLHFRGGMKYQEIADEMGVSLITVKTRMKKAKDSLEEIINNYEKKTGTKLHSVSILPLLWLLYRMSSESTTVPVAVDTAVTGSLAGASGAGIGGATTTAVTKAISTRVLIAVVSTAVVIGGVAVGSQLVDKKQESTIEQGDSEDKELDNESGDDTSSKGNTDTGNDETTDSDANNQTRDENNGSDIDNTGSDDNVTQNNTENGTNTNGTGSNTGAGENSNGTGSNTNNSGTGENANGTGNNSNNSGSENTGNSDSGSESTAAKGTRANPYSIGEKIVVTDDIIKTSSSSSGDVYNFEFTVTDYTPIAELYTKVEGEDAMLYNIVNATVKIIGDGEDPGEFGPLSLFLETNDGGMGYSTNLYTVKEEPLSIHDVKNNTEYRIGIHMDKQYVTQETVAQFLRITYYTTDEQKHMIYIKLE